MRIFVCLFGWLDNVPLQVLPPGGQMCRQEVQSAAAVVSQSVLQVLQSSRVSVLPWRHLLSPGSLDPHQATKLTSGVVQLFWILQ